MIGMYEQINKLTRQRDELRAALLPFARLGHPMADAGDAIPDDASAHYLNLDGLQAAAFKAAARAMPEARRGCSPEDYLAATKGA